MRRLAQLAVDYEKQTREFPLRHLKLIKAEPLSPAAINENSTNPTRAKAEAKLHRAQQKITMDSFTENQIPKGTKRKLPHGRRVSAIEHGDAKHERQSRH